MTTALAEDKAFDYALVQAAAARMAQEPYRAPKPLSRAIRDLNYDQMRDIRFQPKNAIWRMERLPFQLQMFHPAKLQAQRVRLHLVEGEAVHDVPFHGDWFDYGKVELRETVFRELDYAGFRVHYPLNRPDYLDELVVFMGASYFRTLGKGQVYGLSARGIAINTGGSETEEFPQFTEFWIERPDRSATSLRLYALLEGPSVTGAYQFTIQPDKNTIVDVRATLYARRKLDKVGMAALTSMFWYGKTSPHRWGDFRPEVHDSDGLLIQNGAGEWIWRPLVNDGHLRLSYFVDNNPRGFGLLQRERKFSAYEDLEARYQLRPSAWIEPMNNWGRGAVRLVEIPSHWEYDDNIVAFWEPETPLEPGKPLELSYRMWWMIDQPSALPGSHCVATRLMDVPKDENGRRVGIEENLKRFVLDFEGGALPTDPGARITPVITSGNGTVKNIYTRRNEFNGTWRIGFEAELETRRRPVELRCFLKNEKRALSETWSYLWMP
jgi:glucans biosynthesis protein